MGQMNLEANSSLAITSAGYELYLPPTPFSMPPAPARFVMLDDQNENFFDVDYAAPELRNGTSWTELRLHQVKDPAIVFPPNQWSFFEKDNTTRPTGFLVSIQSRTDGVFTAIKLGTVHVQLFQERLMNWEALASLKSSELPDELRAGLMRHLFNQRDGGGSQSFNHVTPADVLDGMPRKWHEDGSALNDELDYRFAGGARICKEQRWKLHANQCDSSPTRPAWPKPGSLASIALVDGMDQVSRN